MTGRKRVTMFGTRTPHEYEKERRASCVRAVDTIIDKLAVLARQPDESEAPLFDRHQELVQQLRLIIVECEDKSLRAAMLDRVNHLRLRLHALGAAQ